MSLYNFASPSCILDYRVVFMNLFISNLWLRNLPFQGKQIATCWLILWAWMELMVKKSLLIWHTMWIVQSLHSWSYSERLLWGGRACDVSTVGTSSCKWMQFLKVLQQFEHCSNLISTNKVAAVYHKTTFHHNVRVWWVCIMLWTTLIWAITKLNDN